MRDDESYRFYFLEEEGNQHPAGGWIQGKQRLMRNTYPGEWVERDRASCRTVSWWNGDIPVSDPLMGDRVIGGVENGLDGLRCDVDASPIFDSRSNSIREIRIDSLVIFSCVLIWVFCLRRSSYAYKLMINLTWLQRFLANRLIN